MPDRPVFHSVSVVTADMAASVRFYQLLGIEVPDTDAAWQAHHRTATGQGDFDFDLDSAVFAPQWNQGWTAGRTGTVIGFNLPDRDAVDATHARLVEAGYPSQQQPYDAFWGARYAIVLDPDGNSVGLMSPPDSARRSAPPTPPA